jgi:hypothetical protein
MTPFAWAGPTAGPSNAGSSPIAKAGAEAMSPIAKATAPSFFDSSCLIRA